MLGFALVLLVVYLVILFWVFVELVGFLLLR